MTAWMMGSESPGNSLGDHMAPILERIGQKFKTMHGKCPQNSHQTGPKIVHFQQLPLNCLPEAEAVLGPLEVELELFGRLDGGVLARHGALRHEHVAGRAVGRAAAAGGILLAVAPE